MHFVTLGAVLGFLGVAAGAFGAHALRGRIDDPLLQAFDTAARYQLIHALALIAVGLLRVRLAGRAPAAAGVLFAAGTVLFSGSLYTMALSGARVWGAIAPLGGACFLAAWLLLAAAAWTAGRRSGTRE